MAFDEWVVAHARISKKPHRAAKLEDTLSFFHQLATLVSSGTPLLQALKIATAQCESVKLRAVLDQITAKVARRAARSTPPRPRSPRSSSSSGWRRSAPARSPARWPRSWSSSTSRSATSRETKRKVKGALMYPMILIIVAVTAVTVMLWMVVPVFAKMFKDMDAELPGITQFVVDASECDHEIRPLCASAMIVAVVVAFKRSSRPSRDADTSAGALMVVPSVGQLVIEMAMYRFASNLSLLLKSGVPMMETMHTDDRDLPDQPDLSRRPASASPRGSRRASPCTRRSRRPGCSCRC